MPQIITNNKAGVETGQAAGSRFTKTLLLNGEAQYGSAAAGSYQETSLTRPVWTCDAAAKILSVVERHSVVGSTTGILVKALGSTPVGSGANVLAAALDHTTAVNVYQTATAIASTTLNQLAVGDQIGWRWTTPGNRAPTGTVEVVLAYL